MIRELIKKNELSFLINNLKIKGTLSLTVVGILQMEEEYGFTERKVYVAESDSRSFVFIVNILSLIPSFSIFWDHEKLTDEDLTLYLKTIPDWNWEETFMISALDSYLANRLDFIITNGDLSCRKMKKNNKWEECYTFQIIPENLEKISKKLPDGLIFGDLTSAHAKYVLSCWKHNEFESVSEYKRLLDIYPSSVVFKEEDKEGDPVAWVILYKHGYIGMLHTNPDFRNQGLGIAVLNNLCQKLKNKKFLLRSQVEKDNEVSYNLYKKIGAKLIQTTCWIRYTACTS